MLSNNNIKNSDFSKECYDSVNGEQHRTNVIDCFVHSNYRHYLCCHFGIAPSRANISTILVLGSAGKIGLSFTKLLKEKKLQFIEIRGRLHFDLNNTQIYEMFNKVNISHVYDLVKNENETLHEQIFSFFNEKNIIVTRVVENQIESKYDQIISPPAFGNQYMKINVSQLFKNVFFCIVKNKCPKTISLNDKLTYAPSNEISNELYKCLTHKNPQIIRPKFSTFTEEEIWEKVISYKQKTISKNDKLFTVLDDIDNESLERQKKPYLTITYCTTNDYAHYSKALNTIKIFEKVLDAFPDISLEIIFFWIHQNNDTSITEIKKKSKLKSRLHVIEVFNENEQFLRETLQTNVVPEYYYRDVGVRLGKGELLMSGSSDVFPSPLFFEIVQRKLFGPFTLLKSLRTSALSFNESFSKYLDGSSEFFTGLDNAGSPCDFGYYFIKVQESIGDLQGALRDTMYTLNGWVFDKYTWAADTAFSWDMAMFKVPFYYVAVTNSMHQDHQLLSYYAPHFTINRRYRKNNMLFCNGVPTKFHKVGFRPNWGISYDFPSNDTLKGKFSHLIYYIIPNKKNDIEYNLYSIAYSIIYNDKEY